METANNNLWFDPILASKDHMKRLRNPIHYYLEKLDFLAAQEEIQRGTDPCIMDENAQTAMDIIIIRYVNLLKFVFCTPYVLDCFDESFNKSCMMSNYEESYKNLNDVYQKLRYIDYAPYPQNKSPNSFNYMPYPPPAPFPCASCCTVSKKSSRKKKQREKKCELETTLQEASKNLSFPLPDKILECELTPTECQIYQQDVVHVIKNNLKGPLPKNIYNRMQNVLKFFRTLNRFMKLLAQCKCLKEASLPTAITAMKCFSFPFFFSALLYYSFKLYPHDPLGRQWDPEDPADARRLVGVIVNREMRGHELYKFLGSVCKYFLDFVKCFGRETFVVSPNTAQYWMHMGLVLDSPKLFELAANQPKIFSVKDVFKWDMLVHALIKNRDKFPLITSALISVRLKTQIEKRLSQNDEKNQQNLTNNSMVLPFEERYLKFNVIDDYISLYKRNALHFEKDLLHWRYGPCQYLNDF